MFIGVGKNATTQHLEKLVLTVDFSKELVKKILDQTREVLSLSGKLSEELDVSKTNTNLIGKAIDKYLR